MAVRMKTQRRLKVATLLGTTALGLAGVVGVHSSTAGTLEEVAPATADAAAQPRQSGVDDSEAPTASQVGEVIVTANKRNERLLSVPDAVTAVTSAELERMQSLRLQDYASSVPGLSLISNAEGRSQIVLRGITTGPSSNATVATYIDETPYGSSNGVARGGLLQPDIDPLDLDRVEVLRGPQGTLYGATSLGGIVKYVTTAPNTEQFGGHVEVDGQDIDGGGAGGAVRGAINIPLVKDKLAVRASAFYRRDPGFIDDPTRGQQNLNFARADGGQVSLLWTPIDRLRVKLQYLTQDLRTGGTADEDVTGLPATTTPIYGAQTQYRGTPQQGSIRNRLYSGTLDYDFGAFDSITTLSYAVLREDFSADLTSTYGVLLAPSLKIARLGVTQANPISSQKETVEQRLVSKPSDLFDWQLGFFFTHERNNQLQVLTGLNLATNAVLPYNILTARLLSRYTEYAGYGDVTLHITKQIDLQAGLRYSDNQQHYTQPTNGLLVGSGYGFTGTPGENDTTFMVSPSYKLNHDNLLYVRIASGYRPGGANGLTPAGVAAGVPNAFGSDTTVNYELGYKGSLLNHTLTVDASLYYIDWQDVQIKSTYAGGFSYYSNAGSATSKGVEAAVTWSPIRDLSFRANVAYDRAELTANAPAINGVSGAELPFVPEFSGHLGVDRDFNLFRDWRGFVGGDLSYVGERTSGFVGGTQPAGFSRPKLPSYTTVDLRTGATKGPVRVEFYIHNVGNERGVIDLTSAGLSSFTNPFSEALIQPRTFGVALASRF